MWVRYPTSSSLSYHPDVIPADNAYGVTIQVIGINSIGISNVFKPKPSQLFSANLPHVKSAPNIHLTVLNSRGAVDLAYNRVRYRSRNFCPSVRASVRSYVRQHLRRSLVFSTSVIAASVKPCIVIVLDIPFKH